ncbi:MAG: ParB/RepB/Spo0J family partition protein [Pseudomonadales bacterium]|nr:ParB/RepB/Spo0J family partition protein [Pseudomonadales bacterium]
MVKKRKLGRGLDALLGDQRQQTKVPEEQAETGAEDNTAQIPVKVSEEATTKKDKTLLQIPVELIQRGKYQPRRDMQPEALEELAESIKKQGVIQPIVVRPLGRDKYEILAGERRWRATQLAGLDKIPAVIREVEDDAAIVISLIENIQRENLNAMEEAVALNRLKEEFDLTHQQVAEAVGKSRAAVSNFLRLLSLQKDVQKMLEYGDIEMGHARALLSLPESEQKGAAQQVISKGLSVRQTESLARNLLQKKPQVNTVTEPESADIRRLQEMLSEKIGVPVIVNHGAKGKGKLVFKYNNLDELDGILSHIK